MKTERKLDKLYTEFENAYGGNSQEEMQEVISNLEKEIAAKEGLLENLTGEKGEKMQKDIEGKKKRLENLRGYSANKTQIEGIRNYRDSLISKLESEVSIRDESLKQCKEAKKSLAEITKKLADENYTTSLIEEDYNNLLIEKEKLEKEIETQSKIHSDSENRILDLQGKIGKCNLAWKTLFTNKDWDLIHTRALDRNTRFTRKLDPEKDIPLSKKGKEKQAENEAENEAENQAKKGVVRKVIDNLGKIFKGMTDEEKGSPDSNKEGKESSELNNKGTNALTETGKEGFFKNLWNKIKNSIKERRKTKETETEEAKENTEKDAFLEGLRRHVDKDYRESVREGINKQYKEAHKIPEPKKEETEQKETEQEER